MAKQLFIGTHGSEDPTRATLPFLSTSGSLDAGHEPAIVLMGDSVVLMRDAVAENVQGIGLPPFKDLLAKAIQNKVPIYV